MICILLELPNKNGVVERKNKTLLDIGKTMLNEYNLPSYFWVEAINKLVMFQIEF